MKEEIVELTKKLIETPSVSDNKEACLDVLNFAADFLGKENKPQIFQREMILV